MFWKGNPSDVTILRNVATKIEHPAALGRRLPFDGHKLFYSFRAAHSNLAYRLCSSIRRIDVLVSPSSSSSYFFHGCRSACSGWISDTQDQDKVCKLFKAIVNFGAALRSWRPWVPNSGQLAGRCSAHLFMVFTSTEADDLQSVIDSDEGTESWVDKGKRKSLAEETSQAPELSLFNALDSKDRSETVSSPAVVNTLNQQQNVNVNDGISWLNTCNENIMGLSNANEFELEAGDLQTVYDLKRGTDVQADEQRPESFVEEVSLVSKHTFVDRLEGNEETEIVVSPVTVSTLNQLTIDSEEESWLNEYEESTMGLSDADDLFLAKSEQLSNVAVIVFDIETTGFRVSDDRIVEFAARDLAGGECSTLQTLVNPERPIPLRATNVHGIDTQMVNRSDIPRWKEVAPILIQYVESRRQSGGPVILIAHNGRRFDAPFLIKEFQRCSLQMPPWWQFVDTVPLAREALKASGLKGLPLNLSALHEHYDLPFAGHAHRALADVNMLALVLQRIMIDLKMPVCELLAKAFSAEDIQQTSSMPPESSVQLPSFLNNLDCNPQEVEISNLPLIEGEDFTHGICMSASLGDEEFAVPWEDEQMEEMMLLHKLDDEEVLSDDIHSCQQASGLDLAESQGHLEDMESLQNSKHKEESAAGIDPHLNITSKALSLNPIHHLSNKQEHAFHDVLSLKANHIKDLGNKQTSDFDGQEMITSKNKLPSQCLTADLKMVRLTCPDAVCKCDFSNVSLRTDSIDISELTSTLKQYVQTKLQRPNFLLLQRVGDFYEAFFEDAEKLVEVCNVGLTLVEGSTLVGRNVPMASLHYAEVDHHIGTLLSKGVTVIKEDLVCRKANGHQLKQKGSVVLTPGTSLDDGKPVGCQNNHLVAVLPPSYVDGTWGLSYCDISSGEFCATQGQGRNSLVEEIWRLQPSEIIYPINANCVRDSTSGHVRPSGMPSEYCYSCRPSADFYPAAAKKKLQQCIGADVLEHFGLEKVPIGVRAAGGLLVYIEETRKVSGVDVPFCRISPYFIEDYMRMDKSTRSSLEVFETMGHQTEGSLLWAMDHTRTAMGKRMLTKWLLRPLLEKVAIDARLNAVEVFVGEPDLRAQVRHDLFFMNDLERLACRIAWGQGTPRDLIALGQSLIRVESLSSQLEKSPSNCYFSALHFDKSVLELGQKIQTLLAVDLQTLIESGSLVKSNVDKMLDTLRGEIKDLDLQAKVFEKHEQERLRISSLKVDVSQMGVYLICIGKDELKDNLIPSDYQRCSETFEDAQCFTTKCLLDIGQKKCEAILKAGQREVELLSNLKQEICSLLDEIQNMSQAVASIDVLSTFAELSALRGYCKPLVQENSREITIVSGRHPVIEICEGSSHFIPNSVYMGYQSEAEKSIEGNDCKVPNEHNQSQSTDKQESFLHESLWPRPDVLILTGPSASGKSCYLRQMGLIQILAQVGSFVPAREAKLGIADAVYMKVSPVADQSAGLSSCKLEMEMYANLLNHATSQSLLLLDGVTGDVLPEEKVVILRAIIEFLAQHVRARTLFSTYCENLCVLETEFPNISNYCFGSIETEDGGVIFEHSIKPGFSMQSCAMIIGKMAGLPEWICGRAAELLSCSGTIDAQHFQVKLVSAEKESNEGENTHSRLQDQMDFSMSIKKECNDNIAIGPSVSPREIEVSRNPEAQRLVQSKNLEGIWHKVCKVLQNQPATYALAKQKGYLASIYESVQDSHVCVNASALFVKKFKQHEHATALESAFMKVLQRPIQLEIRSAGDRIPGINP